MIKSDKLIKLISNEEYAFSGLVNDLKTMDTQDIYRFTREIDFMKSAAIREINERETI